LPQTPLTIGGQAVIEGVMMRGPNGYAISVRRHDGSIRTEVSPGIPLARRVKWLNLPVLRGAVGLIEMMGIGLKSLEFSANEAEKGDREKAALEAARAEGRDHTPGDAEEKPISRIALALTLAFSLVIGLTMFVVVPNLATHFLGVLVGPGQTPLLEEQKPVLYNIVSGFIRLLIVVGYIWAISFLPDVRRLFQYHGAEHKAVTAFENGRDLTVENVQPFTTLHPRCGTTFIAITLIVAVLVFAVFANVLVALWPAFAELRFAWRKTILILGHILIMPVVAGVCFELLRLGGKYRNNLLLKMLIAPGFLFQRLTTKQPDDSMVEVAITALQSALAIPAPVAEPARASRPVPEAVAG
jgi:uncharacterized protein YqhQ